MFQFSTFPFQFSTFLFFLWQPSEPLAFWLLDAWLDRAFGKFPMDMRIPHLTIHIMLESNPLKSRILVWRLVMHEGAVVRNSAVAQGRSSAHTANTDKICTQILLHRRQGGSRKSGSDQLSFSVPTVGDASGSFAQHGPTVRCESEKGVRPTSHGDLRPVPIATFSLGRHFPGVGLPRSLLLVGSLTAAPRFSKGWIRKDLNLVMGIGSIRIGASPTRSSASSAPPGWPRRSARLSLSLSLSLYTIIIIIIIIIITIVVFRCLNQYYYYHYDNAKY